MKIKGTWLYPRNGNWWILVSPDFKNAAGIFGDTTLFPSRAKAIAYRNENRETLAKFRIRKVEVRFVDEKSY
jgi:hypothetical protein